MSATQPFGGYLGQVWRTCFASLQWLGNIMTVNNNSPAAVGSPALLVYQTLLNAVDAVNCYMMSVAWTGEIAALQGIQVLPLSLDATTSLYFNRRITAYQAALVGLQALIPKAVTASATSLLGLNTAPIAYPGLCEWLMTFGYETQPGITTTGDLIAAMQCEAIAWGNVAAQVSVYQGTSTTTPYDAALRQQAAAQQAANMALAFPDFTVNGFNPTGTNGFPTLTGTIGATLANPSLTWNTMATVPALTFQAAAANNAPYSNTNQQAGVIRYALLNTALQLAYLILALRRPAIGTTNLGVLLNNDSLLDFAARETGDFENWSDIAAANGLEPPWTGAAGAAYGSQLYIPAPGSTPPVAGVAQPTYAANVMGTDIYVGPINGQMPAWTGDYQLITGYNNLAISLGRRLQTTLGTLIYHNDFGSRIPPEVGNVQDQSTAGHIAAYGLSALQSDPRVGNVIGASAQIQPNGLGFVQFTATVQPIGQQNAGVAVNEVIAAPAAAA